MTLDEAIEHCKEKIDGCTDCAKEHEQLYYWLLELKLYREMAQSRYYKMVENIKDKSAEELKQEILQLEEENNELKCRISEIESELDICRQGTRTGE